MIEETDLQHLAGMEEVYYDMFADTKGNSSKKTWVASNSDNEKLWKGFVKGLLDDPGCFAKARRSIHEDQRN